MTLKIMWLLSDKATIPDDDPLKSCRLKSVYYFVALELIGFGATFAITQTIGISQLCSVLMHSRHWISDRYPYFDPCTNVYLSAILYP
jgi:hypothetical protein